MKDTKEAQGVFMGDTGFSGPLGQEFRVWALTAQAAKSAEVDELRRELLAEQSKADAAFEELAVTP